MQLHNVQSSRDVIGQHFSTVIVSSFWSMLSSCQQEREKIQQGFSMEVSHLPEVEGVSLFLCQTALNHLEWVHLELFRQWVDVGGGDLLAVTVIQEIHTCLRVGG